MNISHFSDILVLTVSHCISSLMLTAVWISWKWKVDYLRTAGNDSLLTVRQKNVNRWSSVNEFVKCHGQFWGTKLIFVQTNRSIQRKLSRRIKIFFDIRTLVLFSMCGSVCKLDSCSWVRCWDNLECGIWTAFFKTPRQGEKAFLLNFLC